MKKVLSVLLIVILIFTVALSSVSAEYTKPNLSSNAYNSSNVFTQSGYKGQCTWFVWGRALEKLGIKLNSQFYGNAQTWWTKNTTYPKGQTPKGNSIAVFHNGTAGHVVYVEYVIGDTIYFNEANYHVSKNYDGALEHATTANFKNRSGSGEFSGFIYLGGSESSGGDSNFTYPNNAQVNGDFFYVRDSSGNIISGRYVYDGDKITVHRVDHSTQLCYVEYPTSSGVKTGYISNVPSIIDYYYQGQWQNGSTNETVYDASGNVIGTLYPYEKATPLYRANGKLCVVYDTSAGKNTKSGFVKYNGGFTKF